ncbi:hypothetical protein J6590_087723 [Homalodisca vitripennis]|nr:hypothetical protein J6590_087723 [Homalodisca vitripennis]
MSSSLPTNPPAAETNTSRPSMTPSSTHPGPPAEPLTHTAASGYPSPTTLVTSSPAVSSADPVLGSALPRSSSGWKRKLGIKEATNSRPFYSVGRTSSPIHRPAGCSEIVDDRAAWWPYSSFRHPRCSEICDIVASLKTTVEVLEAELECFKAKAVNKNKIHQSDSENDGWVVVQNKSKKIRRKKKFPFPALYIEGDSQVRHLIGLVRQRVSPSTKVGGTCRPGNKTFAEAVTSCSPATSSPVPSVKIDSVFLGALSPADEQN